MALAPPIFSNDAHLLKSHVAHDLKHGALGNVALCVDIDANISPNFRLGHTGICGQHVGEHRGVQVLEIHVSTSNGY